MKKRIVIAGGSGFLGDALARYLESQYEIIILTRHPNRPNHKLWDGVTIGPWIESIKKAHAIINLAGKSVDCRYTEKNRKLIRRSRVNSTKVIGEAINACGQKAPPIWINASSATIYHHAETMPMTEDTGVIGDDFSMNVCKDWESTFFNYPDPKDMPIRKIALRTSIVLGRGSAYQKLKWITRLGMGGAQGRGTQMVSWIHIDDFCRAVEYILNSSTLSGPINVTAQGPIRNAEFMKALRKSLRFPFGLGQPKWLLEIGAMLMGTETELLLKSRYVLPKRLLSDGYEFLYPDIEGALLDLSTPS